MHAAVLLPMVEDALRCAGLGIAEVDAFGCVVGPGSLHGRAHRRGHGHGPCRGQALRARGRARGARRAGRGLPGTRLPDPGRARGAGLRRGHRGRRAPDRRRARQARGAPGRPARAGQALPVPRGRRNGKPCAPCAGALCARRAGGPCGACAPRLRRALRPRGRRPTFPPTRSGRSTCARPRPSARETRGSASRGEEESHGG